MLHESNTILIDTYGINCDFFILNNIEAISMKIKLTSNLECER